MEGHFLKNWPQEKQSRTLVTSIEGNQGAPHARARSGGFAGGAVVVWWSLGPSSILRDQRGDAAVCVWQDFRKMGGAQFRSLPSSTSFPLTGTEPVGLLSPKPFIPKYLFSYHCSLSTEHGPSNRQL